LGFDTSSENFFDALFRELALRNRARAMLRDKWSVPAGPLPPLPGTVLLRDRDGTARTDDLLLGFDRGLARLQYGGQTVHLAVAADDDARADNIAAALRTALPAGDGRDDGTVRVTFWSYSQYVPDSVRRDLETPAWADIRRNYAAPTAAALQPVFEPAWRPSDGRLLLWHGEPGTGKTYAVRALMRAWQPWCDAHVVIDPEQFFGKPDYMFNVLLEGSEKDGRRGSRWQLLVLEDTGELLSADARERNGQGLSRLLNLCDGLVGQGLNNLVLITTNEELGRLHRAVSRPGRCVESVEFAAFDSAAAAHWCAASGCRIAPPPGGATLADLYARLDGRAVAERRQALGFAAA
jgi:hypothetical protein